LCVCPLYLELIAKLDRRLQSVSTFVSSTPSIPISQGNTELFSRPQWSEEMPQAVLFPSNKPSSRADAVVLNQWVTKALSNYAQRQSVSLANEEDLSKTVEELVPILSIGLHEVVRQVTQHCLERGVVLEKIWRTYIELFERALNETRASLRRHQEKTARVEADLARTSGELTDLQAKHPQQIEKLSTTLAAKFAQRQEELEEQLRTLRNENQALQEHLQEQTDNLRSWFPMFLNYKDSSYRSKLSSFGPFAPSSSAPEARIAADFRRVLSVMPAEGLRRVGFFISSLLGLRGAQLSADTVENLAERKEHNQWKIEQLEARVRELKGPA